MSRQASIKKRKPLPEAVGRRVLEGIFIVTLAVSLFLFLSLLTYHNTDAAWSHATMSDTVANAGGKAGAWFADVLLYVFGYLAYLFPFMLVYAAGLLLQGSALIDADYRVVTIRLLGFVLFMMGGSGLVNLDVIAEYPQLPFTAGGVLGHITATYLHALFNPAGARLFLFALTLTGMTLFIGFSWLALFELVGRSILTILRQLTALVTHTTMKVRDLFRRLSERRNPPTIISQPIVFAKPERTRTKRLATDVTAPIVHERAQRQTPSFDINTTGDLPCLSLLDTPIKTAEKHITHSKLEALSRAVEQRLLDFGVDVQVVAVHPGPVVTRFELQLAAGVKVSKITNLAKDLARSLSVHSVRIVEIIPGKPVIGLELPNEKRQIVCLADVLATKQDKQAASPLSLALGVDIAGYPVVVNLAKMPHLLVAGTTGSGKSVALNAMILSLLFNTGPDQVRLILIDPKMLELSVYDGIPHLLTPVVTDVKDAANTLRWAVAEMERRYRLMAALGVRNLVGYNLKVREAEKKGKPLLDPFWQGDASIDKPDHLTTLPYIVVVIDELADMMMVVGKKVEQLIARIAQKARAAGIHLILATQRPSVDVLTGLIKSNIPTRISFQVSSKIDSRTILDQQGAEQLLGAGDMLYLPPGAGVPVRVHGAFVADREVHQVVADWKKRGKPVYLDEVLEQAPDSYESMSLDIPGLPTEEVDELYDEAVRFVTETRKASISSVQRRFKIGYNRAARLIEEMERVGIVSSMESHGGREVLVKEPPPAH